MSEIAQLWGIEMMTNTINNNNSPIEPESSMISALKLSPSCMCSEEAVEYFDASTTVVIDVRKFGCTKRYNSIRKVRRVPYDKSDIVADFVQNKLNIPRAETITHFIFVCDHGYRSENIARQLDNKGIEGIYHLCGGYENHEIELAQLLLKQLAA